MILGIFILININLNAQDSLKTKKPTEISIQEAIEKGMVELKISGTYDSRKYYEVVDNDGLHYGKCMAIFIKSKIDSAVLLRLDCGTQLIPDDTAVQTMIVTQKAIFPMYPNYEYASRFYAMCGQLHDAAPIIESTFSIGTLADNDLVKLATYLGENYIQNMTGQHAMWAYTDGADLKELEKYGADSLSILKTKDILYSLNLETNLSPKLAVVKVVKLEEFNESDNMNINPYYVYAGAGLILLLASTTLILIIKSYRKNESS